MSSLEEIKKEREEKRDALIAKGINPYPAKSNRTHRISEVKTQFDALVKEGKEVTLAGRVMSLRRHGGSTFADIFDGSDRLQVFFSRERIGEEAYELLHTVVNQSDFIEIRGTVFATERGARWLPAPSLGLLPERPPAGP